jgi:hypothetical protein
MELMVALYVFSGFLDLALTMCVLTDTEARDIYRYRAHSAATPVRE